MNEIQELPLDFAAVEAGSVIYGYDGDNFDSFAFDADEATIQAALDSHPLGPGTFVVTKLSDRIRVEFGGSLANTDVSAIYLSSSTLKQKADTLSVSNTQNGVADAPVTPSNTITTAAVSPSNEFQFLNLNGAATGAFDLNGNSTSATVVTLDQAGILAAVESIWGSGNVGVSDYGGGNFGVEFQGGLAATNIPEMTITNDTTDGGGVQISSLDGVPGVHQQDTCTFDATPTSGAMIFDGNPLIYNINAADLILSGKTASGTPASGSIVTTWNDYDPHTPVSVSGDTLTATGQPQIVLIETEDSPSEGGLTVTLDSSTSGEFFVTAPSPGEITLWTAGGSAGAWTYTAQSNASNVSASATEVTPLRKGYTPGATITAQEGAPETLPAGGRRRNRRRLTGG